MIKYKWANLLCLVPFFLGLYVALSGDTFYEIEKVIFNISRIISPYADIPMRVITELGSAVGVILIAVIIVVWSASKKHFLDFGLPIALTIIISRIVNVILKYSFDRPRPDFKVFDATESSFPSGHSQNNMAFYIIILLVALMICNNHKKRLILKISLVSLPLLIGLTRVYFGVHYISDVLSGWSIGFIIAYNCYYIYFKYLYPKLKREEKINELSWTRT